MPKSRLYRMLSIFVVWGISLLIGGLPLAIGVFIVWVVFDIVYTLYLRTVFLVVRAAYRYGNYISIRRTLKNRNLTFYHPVSGVYSVVEFIRYRPSENAQS